MFVGMSQVAPAVRVSCTSTFLPDRVAHCWYWTLRHGSHVPAADMKYAGLLHAPHVSPVCLYGQRHHQRQSPVDVVYAYECSGPVQAVGTGAVGSGSVMFESVPAIELVEAIDIDAGSVGCGTVPPLEAADVAELLAGVGSVGCGAVLPVDQELD